MRINVSPSKRTRQAAVDRLPPSVRVDAYAWITVFDQAGVTECKISPEAPRCQPPPQTYGFFSLGQPCQ